MDTNIKLRIATSLMFVLIAAKLCNGRTATQSDEQNPRQMKTLAGSWEGHVTTSPQQAEIEGKLMRSRLRTTSMGHTLMHEMTEAV